MSAEICFSKRDYTTGGIMKEIPCTIVRGGTSKGVFFERDQLPPAGPERDEIVLSVYGSPDPRQIDGLGGADKLTSKTAIMGPPTRPDCDVDYLFGQVNIALPRIDWASNCGNISAGAAVYSIYKGYVKSNRSKARIAVHQVNTGCRLMATVPLSNGKPKPTGDFEIGGVPGKGARIDLNFQDFSGCILNRGVLPTGRSVDKFTVPGSGKIDVSVIDMANLCLFVRAADVGLDHEKPLAALQNDKAMVAKLEAIRAVVSAELGFIEGENAAEALTVNMNPLLFIVGIPRSYAAIDGSPVEGNETDLFARSITRALFSKTYPASGSIATGVGCGIPGTILSEMLTRGERSFGSPYRVRVGHPSGILTVEACVDQDDAQELHVRSAVIGRTARVLMEGVAFIR